MVNLGTGNDNVNIDGATPLFIDFGGMDTYTILNSLSGDVTITDNQVSIINLPLGLAISDALFLADGVQFTVNGNTVTLIGSPSLFTFVFGGTPLDPTGGTAQNFSETATSFGTTLPAPGDLPNAATNTGAVNGDGSIGESGNLVDLSGRTDVTAQNGISETFVLDFDSSSGNALSSDAVVSVTGFDLAEDILRFNDANGTPQDAATFLNGLCGAVIVANGFAEETTINFQDDNGGDNVPAAQLTLIGITDATLGGATPFFEIT